MSKLARGLFISFEGGEGAGKTTQVKLLVDRLSSLDLSVKSFREPGGVKISEAIRAITHDKANTDMGYRTEALLMAASRAQLVDEAYQPLIQQKHIVIADRYVDSSYVYQGYARGLGYDEVKAINGFAINGLLPDLTILLDIETEIGLDRRHSTTKTDRFDGENKAFHHSVNQAYRLNAKRDPYRIKTVDASQTIAEVHEAVWQYVLPIIESARR